MSFADKEIKPYPPHGTEPTLTEEGFQRFLPLPTPQDLRGEYLFGIPLRSPMTKQEMTDKTLQKFIIQAVSEIEHDLDLFISPITIQDERHNYHWADFYQSFGFLLLDHKPLLSVSSLKVCLPTSGSNEHLIDWPLEWVKVQREAGIIQLLPLTGSGSLIATMALKGAGFPIKLFSAQNYPQFWAVTYTVGFTNDEIPAMIVELIALTAALKALQIIAPVVVPYGNYSINIDGLGQSTSLPGPGWLNARIQGMLQQKQELIAKAKKFYQQDLLMTTIG